MLSISVEEWVEKEERENGYGDQSDTISVN